MGLLDRLNEQQKEAVIHTDGPIMVMAGAGSGKTGVLTTRIAYLVKEVGIPLEDILAVTFTNKAANEMKQRVAKLLEEEDSGSTMWVSTIHGLCFKILRRCMHLIPPFTRNFNILDETDSLSYVKRALKELELNEMYKDKEIKKLISLDKNGETIVFSKHQEHKQKHYQMIYERYSLLLEKDNCLDFDDLLIFTIKIFNENSNILQFYQEKFQYIMIDEFQDTNLIQYQLIKILALKHQNLFVVGDQDQSIYAFRGAKVENIDRFRRDFPLTKVILLERNYRSTKGILDLANAIIDENKNRIKKNLYTEKKESVKPVFYKGMTSYDEISYVLFKIESLMKKYEYSYSDFAIIYRANYLSRNLEDELVKRGIKYQIYGGMSFFNRMEVKDIVAYLSLIADTKNDFALKRIINVPKRKIGDAMISKLMLEAESRKCSLFEAIDTLNGSGVGHNNLVSFKFMILELKDLIGEGNLPKLIDFILDKSGYLDYLKTLGEEGETRLENVKELKSILAEAEEEIEGSSIEQLEQITQLLSLRTDMDIVNDDVDSIRLMTFHQAKGLEFKVVFMIAMEEGIFPSINCISKENIEEERRICYVGITRARERLYLTCAQLRNVFGVNQKQMVSRFINEDSDLIKIDGKKKSKDFIAKQGIVLAEDSGFLFHPGDKIEHKVFGKGLVVQVDDPLIIVAFKAPIGVKKLSASHPSIRLLPKEE